MGGTFFHQEKVQVAGIQEVSSNEIISNGFFTVDRKWTVKYWNKEAEKIVGVPSEDILGKNLWQAFAKVIPPEFSQIFNRSFLAGSPVHFEEYLGKMGDWTDVIIYHCDDRVSVSFKTILRPAKIDDLRQRLAHLNDLYRIVTEITSDCLWEWDLDTGEIFWIDGGHKRVFGYHIENALIPQSFWEDRVHPEDRAEVLEKLDKMKKAASNGFWEADYRFRKADGDYVYVQDRGKVTYDAETGTSGMIGTTQDVSKMKTAELKLAEERLIKHKEITYAVMTAQENERLEIGMELQNNLNQILCAARLYIELIKPEGEEKLKYINKSSGYIMDVIEEIRTIAKKLRMPGMNMGLFESIRFQVEKLNMLHPVKIEFHINGIDEEDIDETIQLDIFRIIQETTGNIIQHAAATHAEIDLSRNGNKITLKITDNGQGCDLLKAKMGMGMINILSHAELSQSQVTTCSSPGNGYELKIVLPLRGHIETILETPSDYDD